MSKPVKIFIIVMTAIAVVALLGAVMLKVWARAGRISPADSLVLVKDAWGNYGEYYVNGKKVIEYRIGDQIYRIRPNVSKYENLPLIEQVIENLFTQVPFENANEFLNSVDVSHAGRTHIAGRNVEKINILPRGYSGHSTQLWIDDETHNLLGWYKLSVDGKLVRGWHYRIFTDVVEHPDVNSVDNSAGEMIEGSMLFDRLDLISPEELDRIIEYGMLRLPEWIPDGFRIKGGRWIHGQGPPAELSELAPGLRIGQLRQGVTGGVSGGVGGVSGGVSGGVGEGRGLGGQFHVIYSDGLNTISLIMMPSYRLGQGLGTPDRVHEVIKDKADEMESLFHTSMAGRLFPGNLVLAFGGIDKTILVQMLDSIPFDPDQFPNPDFLPENVPYPRDGVRPEFDGEGPPFDRPGIGGGGGGIGDRRDPGDGPRPGDRPGLRPGR